MSTLLCSREEQQVQSDYQVMFQQRRRSGTWAYHDWRGEEAVDAACLQVLVTLESLDSAQWNDTEIDVIRVNYISN